MLYTDPSFESEGKEGLRFGKADRYHAPFPTRIVTLIALVVSSVLLLCAKPESTEPTEHGSSEQKKSAVVSFSELLTRAFELAPKVQENRSKAAIAAETNTYEMPGVVPSAKEKNVQLVYHNLVGHNTPDPERKKTEYTVMCCLAAVYAKMIDPGNEGLAGHAGLFGLLASDVCRSFLLSTHNESEMDASVVAMHWYLLGRHDIYTDARRQNTEKAISSGDDNRDDGERKLEALLSNSKSFLSAAFSIVASK